MPNLNEIWEPGEDADEAMIWAIEQEWHLRERRYALYCGGFTEAVRKANEGIKALSTALAGADSVA